MRPLFVSFVITSLLLASRAQALDNQGAVTVTPLLQTTSSWDGRPLRWPQGEAELTGLIVTIAPGGETGWHSHPVPSFGLLLEGELEITLGDGRTKHICAGEALAEVVGVAHNGRVVGDVPARLVVFYAGSKGVPLTVR
jgi:quercetin dioxygenase-like cupin family protein